MALPLATGDVVDAYVVRRVIGVGGMSVVAEATHQSQHLRVAIKLMLPGAMKSNDLVMRFHREQRTLAQLHSEHIVRTYGAGEHRGMPYMILELLDGTDLHELIKNKGPLEIDDAVQYGLQACHAIAEAHALGIIHRDIKPSNLFLTRRSDGSPRVKVLDFGISKVPAQPTTGRDAALTKSRMIMGSPHYMAPEQMLSARDATVQSDIWALGVTMYELLTKTLPFAAEDTEQVVQRVLSDKPTPLRKMRPMTPGGLEATIMRCIVRRPSERYANIADFAQRLADFGPQHSRYAVSSIYELVAPTNRDPMHSIPEVPAAPLATEADDTTLYLNPAAPTASGFGWVAALVATLTFALGAGFGWVMSLSTDPTGASSPVTRSPQTAAMPQSAAAATDVHDAQPQPQGSPIDLDDPGRQQQAADPPQTAKTPKPQPTRPPAQPKRWNPKSPTSLPAPGPSAQPQAPPSSPSAPKTAQPTNSAPSKPPAIPEVTFD